MTTQIPENLNYTKEFKGATPTSKKRWYYNFDCPSCGKPTSKVKYKGMRFLCSSCSQSEGYTTESFIARAKAKFGDTYSYEKTEYTGSLDKVTITCPTHGDFTPRTSDFLDSTVGCPECARESRRERITFPVEHYTKDLPPNFSVKSYDKVGYHEPVTMNCVHHGEFLTTFGALTSSKHVCQRCAADNHQKQSMRKSIPSKAVSYLYYVYIPSIDMYKLGVTTKKTSGTLAGVKHTVIWKKRFPYEVAVELEHRVHTNLQEFRYKGEKLIRAGNTELYKIDIEDKVLDIIVRASVQECTVEKILNKETPTSNAEDNPVLNQEQSCKCRTTITEM